MAPTPWIANGVLRIQYAVNSLVHKHDSYCDIDEVAGVWKINTPAAGTLQQLPQDLGDRMWEFAKAWYHTGVPAPTWTLFEKVGISLIPRDSGTLSSAGTSATVGYAAQQLSMTFADLANHRFNDYWFENNIAPGQKSIVSSTPASLTAYIEAYTAPTSDEDMFYWVRSRGDNAYDRFLRWTTSENHALRRARGLA